MRSLFRFFSINSLLILLTACDGGGDTEALKQAITVNKLNIESVVLKPSYSETLNSDVTYFDTDDTETIIATANSENGTNISNDVAWSTSNTSIAQIDQNGLLTTFAATGAVTVYAKIGNVQGALNIYVSNAQLDSIEYRYKSSNTPISAGNNIATLCDSVPLEVVGTFLDMPNSTERLITEKLEWAMAMTSPVGGRITNNASSRGVFSAYTYTDQGAPFVVSTAYKGSDQTSLSLHAAETGSEGTVFLRSTLVVAPLSVSFPVGDTEQLHATVQFRTGVNDETKNITNNVEWLSADTSIATVSNTGLVTGAASSVIPIDITAQCIAAADYTEIASSKITITDAATVIAVEIRS
ncbi:Ig-like domain-containing protein, partial [Kaarinaea lacus]